MAAAKGLGVTQAWSVGNQLTLLSGRKSGHNESVHFKCAQTAMSENVFWRSLVSESYNVFHSIQRHSSKAEPLSRNDAIKASRKYRSVIHCCFANLRKQSLEREPNANQNDEPNGDHSLASALSVMFYRMEMVWNLCEILYMDIHRTGFLLNQLMSWVRWHFTASVSTADAVLNCDVPHIHHMYWDVMIAFVLRGDNESARRFLELHPNCNSDEQFVVIRDLLNKMPVMANYQLLHEFYLRWQSWNEQCVQALSDGYFETNDKLSLIARILCGDIYAFKEVLHLFESWCHLMVSLLLFTDPCIKENNLNSLCVQCIEIYYSDSNAKQELKCLDSVIVAAFDYDLMQVIQESCVCFDDNWWFATHFIDLLYNSNQLDSHQIESPDKFRESFVIDYANSLMTCNSLWTFAIDYLYHCVNNGLHFIELNLQRVSIHNDISAHKVIHYANKLGLNYLSKSISKILSRKWLMKKKLGLALFWAIRSEDPALTNHIANIFLVEFDKSGEFLDEDILSNLGRLLLISDRLTFLAKYYEFHELKKENQLKTAAELLVSLIVSNIAPKFFISRLLMDSLPLLETQNIVLNSEQTSQILASLEDILSDDRHFDKSINLNQLKEREDILRLAIARNLARSFVVSN